METTQGLAAMVLVVLTMTSWCAVAAVSREQAAKLRSELTPMGAERAGNANGTIPAWEGGYTTVWPGYRSGAPRPDPFADEKPLLQISPANMGQYDAQLSDGA